jgi:methionyl-tRNA synthetase
MNKYNNMITFDEFKNAEIKIGTILSAEKVPDADKLIKFMINLGEEGPRQILSGISEYYPDPLILVGKQVPVLTNLPTRIIRGLESQGMVLYAVGEGFLTTIEPGREIPPGTPVH